MKKFLKVLMYFFLIVIIGAGGVYLYYNNFRQIEQQDIFNAVPNNAIFVIETSNAPKAWDEFTQSDIWAHLSQNPNLAEIDTYMIDFQEILAYPGVSAVFHGGLTDRKVLLSAHMIGGNDYDFMYIIDMKKAPNFMALTKALKLTGFDVKDRKYKGEKIIELHDNLSKDVIYITLFDNLLLVSYVGNLIEDALLHRLENKWNKNPNFIKVANTVRNTQLANFYFNYKLFPSFVNVFSDEKTESLDDIAKQIAFSAYSLDIDDKFIKLNGYTSLDSLPSYFKALANVNPGKSRIHEILSDQTAFLMSIGFEDFNTFYAELTNQYTAESPEDFEDIQSNVENLEKLLKINLQANLFNWIGQEIAFAKFRPDAETRVEDVIVAIHANDIQLAKDGFGHIIQQVERRSPVKFSMIVYKNFEISFLDVKGFFRVFLGKLFEKLEKPYITYIEDYVILSNSLPAIKKAIDDYALGQTLGRSEKFVDFRDNFSPKSNVSMFIQMPKMYTNLYQFSSLEDRKVITENKELILSFARIGFQLNSDDGMFQNFILAEHDTAALVDDQLELIVNNLSDSSSVNTISKLDILKDISDTTQFTEGPYKIYFDVEQTVAKFEAMAVGSKLNGMAKLYFENGKIQANLNFEDNILSGECSYYYNDENSTQKLLCEYTNGSINGLFREFHENGAQKSTIEYEDGMPNGEAKYFYSTGSLKMEGEFKDSLKSGRWKFYDKKGELISKKRYKKGI
ncbi:MAG: DUF3352 domain-containing protein [Bacteroidales bacterium]|nr:DUF3352 domain-containing protein [Bacteroidales bacterium]